MQAFPLYTPYFTVPEQLSHEIAGAVNDVASGANTQLAWEKPRRGNVAFRMSSVQRNAVVDASKVLEHVSLGAVAMLSGIGGCPDSHHEVWYDFYATALGEMWLQKFGQQLGCLVVGDKHEKRNRIYTYENTALMSNNQDKLGLKLAEIESSVQTQTFRFDNESFEDLASSDTLGKLQGKLGESNVSLNNVEKSLKQTP
ncbi:hypothetical protein BKA63DRAFT_586044 [Paraphoma chrysanthemicola]|nr:hypothetical protein BKA63DRAFT_586044 [Paraphoma chrysanthemicola]